MTTNLQTKMNDAVLYAESNNFQRETTKKVFAEFAPLLQWRNCDTILDIGCGTGDVTMELILPLLPSNFRHLIGCDISDKMIEYAQQHYVHPKVVFDKLDIADRGDNVDGFLIKFGNFNHIISLFCLHWAPDQKTVMENISKLLTPDGDCFLMFLTTCDAFSAYLEMSKSIKWSKYMYDARLYTSPYHCSASPADDLRSLMQSVGFPSCNIRIQEETYLCKGYEELENIVRSVNPFLHRIPTDEQKDFISDLMQMMIDNNEDLKGEKYLISIHVAIILAKK